jgi:hypothetical protein
MHMSKLIYETVIRLPTLFAFAVVGAGEPALSSMGAPSGALMATLGISDFAAETGGDKGVLRAPGGT